MTTDFDRHERQMWTGRASAYETSFAKLCAYPASALLDAAGVSSGTRLLDVGTGTGTVAAHADRRGAIVTAVDAEPSMVDAARQNVPAADVRHGTLPDLPFPDDSFDAAVTNFVVNHVGDPRAAVAELRRVVRPGGRIALTIWPQPPSPLHALWDQILDAAHARPTVPMAKISGELNFVRTESGLVDLLRSAGVTDVVGATIAWVHRVEPEEWWSGPAGGVATIGLIVTSHTPDMIQRIKGEYDRVSAAYLGTDGLLGLPTHAHLAAGRA